MDENKIPVIVGVGQINDREERLTSVELMAAALQNADADGGGGWLGRADALDVVAQLSFPEFKDASAPLAQMLEIAPRHCAQTRYPMGDSPVALLNTAKELTHGIEIVFRQLQAFLIKNNFGIRFPDVLIDRRPC